MNHALILMCAFSLILLSPMARGALHTETVEYRQGDAVLEGYLAYDEDLKGPRPGVLVVHEWDGLGAFAREKTEQLAQAGYITFAADIYGKGVRPQTREERAREAGKYRGDRDLLRARAAAALEVLRKQERVDPQRLAAIGFCFGGTTVLELARSGADVKGVVSFHGGLATTKPAAPGGIQARILALTGGDDPSVPDAEVSAFMQEMRQAKANWQLTSYGGAVHAFMNPKSGEFGSPGAAYHPLAAQRAWREMLAFFEEIFQPQKQGANK
jgi:dienelactone hydrolase